MQHKDKNFSLRNTLASFKYAIHGLYYVLKKEHNFRIHLAIAIAVIVLGIIFHITQTEWIAVILCTGIVFVAEIMNTAIEKTMDMISPQKNENAGIIKDIAAGGVLIAAVLAVVMGIIIFLPYFKGLIKQ